ncbi:hypothetical protein Trydic_g8833 [Trypoxylus dichotomus]
MVEMLMDHSIALIEDLVFGDRCLRVKSISEISDIVSSPNHPLLHINRDNARRKPKHLSAVQRRCRVEYAICDPMEENPVDVVKRIVTWDEVLVIYYGLFLKRELMDDKAKHCQGSLGSVS